MNSKTLATLAFTATLALTAALALLGCAQSPESPAMDMDHHDHAVMAPALPPGAIDLHNTLCVVSGDKVGTSQVVEVYQGKVYHLCCADCPAEFKKDPAKYAQLVAADPAKYGIAK